MLQLLHKMQRIDLLIEPQGIEIWKYGFIINELDLLIEPQGIEIQELPALIQLFRFF